VPGRCFIWPIWNLERLVGYLLWCDEHQAVNHRHHRGQHHHAASVTRPSDTHPPLPSARARAPSRSAAPPAVQRRTGPQSTRGGPATEPLSSAPAASLKDNRRNLARTIGRDLLALRHGLVTMPIVRPITPEILPSVPPPAADLG
jgi:hypothetical protein